MDISSSPSLITRSQVICPIKCAFHAIFTYKNIHYRSLYTMPKKDNSNGSNLLINGMTLDSLLRS